MTRAVFETNNAIIPYMNVLAAHVTAKDSKGNALALTVITAVNGVTLPIEITGASLHQFARGFDLYCVTKANNENFEVYVAPIPVEEKLDKPEEVATT